MRTVVVHVNKKSILSVVGLGDFAKCQGNYYNQYHKSLFSSAKTKVMALFQKTGMLYKILIKPECSGMQFIKAFDEKKDTKTTYQLEQLLRMSTSWITVAFA